MGKRRESEERDATDAGPGLVGRVLRSVLPGPLVPRSDRERRWVVLNLLLLHLRPTRVPERTLRYTHTFGLGGSCLVLFLILAATGVLMMFVYEPTPERAYNSILGLENDVLFGPLVRNVHHWTANLLVVVAGLHLLRVFFTGGFWSPRQFNWIVGLGLLAGVLASNFTGYLLPWDQLSYWAITISTGMLDYVPGIGPWLRTVVRGGSEIGAPTLIVFYTLHTTVIPVAVVGLMAFHFWRVRRAGGVVVPRAQGEELEEKPHSVLFVPNLLLREVALACVLVAGVTLFAVVVDAPLGAAANPGMSPNPAKAPWYFAGLQELLLHFHPVFAVVVIPALLAVGLLMLPYVEPRADASGVWLRSRRGRRLAASGAALSLVVTSVLVLVDELWIDLAAWLPGAPPVLRDGLLPLALVLVAMVGYYLVLRSRWAASRDEAIAALFVVVVVALVVATLVCVWFRGPGMALAWPGVG